MLAALFSDTFNAENIKKSVLTKKEAQQVRVIATLFALFISFHALAATAQQTKPADDAKTVRDELRAEKHRLVTENMQLTESEAAAFWPVYEAYQKEMDALGDRMNKLVENYGITHKVMTDDTAAKLLEELLNIQSDRVQVQKAYVPKFQKALPMTKVARFYQIENKFRAAVDYDITSQIPLLED